MDTNGHYGVYGQVNTPKIGMDDIFADIHRMDVTALFRAYLYKVEIYVRFIAILFSIIVFGCIADKAYEPGWCVMNTSAACDYGIVVGVIALLSNVIIILIDLSMELVIHITLYRIMAALTLAFNLLWGFNWFVVFCFMANQWSLSPKHLYYEHFKQGVPIVNNVQAAITFSLFSFLLYLVIVVLGVMRLLRGPGNILELTFYHNLWKKAMYSNLERKVVDSESNYHTPIVSRLEGSFRNEFDETL